MTTSRINLSRPLNEQPALLRLREAAALLGRTDRTLRSWEARGLIRFVRPAGGVPLVERSELERLLNESRGARAS
jgi:excisionase family DNA binding protein